VPRHRRREPEFDLEPGVWICFSDAVAPSAMRPGDASTKGPDSRRWCEPPRPIPRRPGPRTPPSS